MTVKNNLTLARVKTHAKIKVINLLDKPRADCAKVSTRFTRLLVKHENRYLKK